MWPELKPRANALLRIVSMVFVLVFALVFVWYGIKFVQFGWNQRRNWRNADDLSILIAWPLTGFTWLLFGGERIGTTYACGPGTPHRWRQRYEPARRARPGATSGSTSAAGPSQGANCSPGSERSDVGTRGATPPWRR